MNPFLIALVLNLIARIGVMFTFVWLVLVAWLLLKG